MIKLTDNFDLNKPAHLDSRVGPYENTTIALESIPFDKRVVGLTIVIDDGTGAVDYWFKDGTNDGDLILKSSGSSSVAWGQIGGTLSNQTDLNTALNSKEPTIANGTTSQYFRGDKTFQTLDKTSVGLDNVDNTSDLNKPISTSVQTALNGKFNVPTGTTSQYLDGAGTPTDFPTTGQSGTLVRQIRNQTGATLTKGTIVYISGASGNKALVSKAIATSDATSAQTFGLVQSDIPNNQNGICVVRGELTGLDTSSFAEGTQLYLSPSVAGTYTSTKQYAPNHLVYIGIVTRSHATQGSIEVAIQNGYELDELHNVVAQTPTNRDGLFFNNSTQLWESRQIVSDDLPTLDKSKVGLNNVDNTSDVNKPISTAVQTALNGKEPSISSGTTSQYFRGDKTFQTLDKTSVGLGNVDNTSDANKPISTATQTALSNITSLYSNVSNLSTTSTTSATLASFTIASSIIPIGGVIRIVGIVERTASTGNFWFGININSAGAKYFQVAGQTQMQFEILIAKKTSTTLQYGLGPSNGTASSYAGQAATTTIATQDGSNNFVISLLGFVGTAGATMTLQFVKVNLL